MLSITTGMLLLLLILVSFQAGISLISVDLEPTAAVLFQKRDIIRRLQLSTKEDVHNLLIRPNNSAVYASLPEDQ